jgi:hypothetical protein
MSDVLLRPQNTAYTFRAGPFLNANDAKTRVTNANITQAMRLISKAGAAYAQSAQAGILAHESAGYYPLTLATGDFDTLGSLELDIDAANCLPFIKKFFVVTVDTYGALMGTGNGILANLAAINGASAAAIRLALSAGRMIPVTVTNAAFAPTTTEFQVSDYSSAGTDLLKGRSMIGLTGTGMIDQATKIAAYSVVGGRGHFTVAALNAPPPNGSTWLVV